MLNVEYLEGAWKFVTGWIESLQANIEDYTYSVGISYNGQDLIMLIMNPASTGYEEVDNLTISVKNYAEFDSALVEESYSFNSHTDYSADAFRVDASGFVLVGISTNVPEIEVVTNTYDGAITSFYFVINDEISLASYPVRLTFTFSNGYHNLTYTTGEEAEIKSVTILPYMPSENETYSAVASNSFDLINDVFDMTGALDTVMADGDRVTSFVVSEISNPDLVVGEYNNVGYIWENGWNQNSCVISFNGITGNTVTLDVTYTITYSNGRSYSKTVSITILNNQSVSVVYPYSVGSGTGNTMSVNFAPTATQEDRQALATSNSGSVYYVNFDQFETVFIPTSASGRTSATIMLGYDPLLSLSRVQIANSTSEDWSIELIAYSSASSFNSFLSNISVNNQEKSVTFTFPASVPTWSTEQGVIFKITSSSGAVGYYKVILFRTTGTSDTLNNIAKDNYLELSISSPAVVTEILQTADDTFNLLQTKVSNDEFLSAFGVDYLAQNISFFVTNATFNDNSSALSLFTKTNAENEDEAITVGTNLSGVEFNPGKNQHVNLKIAVVCTNFNRAVQVGTIVAYIQPQNREVANSTVVTLSMITNQITGEDNQSAIATGRYSATITSQTTIPVPFNAGGNGEIVALASSGYILNSDIVTHSNIARDGIIVVEIADGSTLTIVSYADTQLRFTVKYTLTTNVIVYVEYTLNPIQLSNAQISRTLGSYYETTGFEDSVLISEFVGGYNKSVTITNSDNTLDITLPVVGNRGTDRPTGIATGIADDIYYNYSDTGILTLIFELKTAQYIRNLTITLIDYVGDVNFVNVVVTVNPALLFANNSAEPTTSFITTRTDSYSTANGSYITVNSTQVGDVISYNFISAGQTMLTITTLINSSLRISFSTEDGQADKYIINPTRLGDDNLPYITIDGTASSTNICFAHIMTDADILMEMDVQVSNHTAEEQENNFYTESTTVYVNLAETYYLVEAIYEMSGSDHDVVLAGSYYNSQTLFEQNTANITAYSGTSTMRASNDYRLRILDDAGEAVINYSLEGMGFTDEENINYISVAPYNSLVVQVVNEAGNLQFLSPADSNNNLAQLSLTNALGVNVVYNFRILSSANSMVGTNVHYSTEEGKEGSQYITLSPGTSGVSGSATILDQFNNVFYVSTADITLEIDDATSTISGISATTNQGSYTVTFNAEVTIVITVSGANFNVSMAIPSALDVEKIVLTFTCYGNGLIGQNFEIAYLNNSIEIDSNELSFYGGRSIVMANLFDSSSTVADLTYVITDGSYSLGGTGANSYTGEEIKNLFADSTIPADGTFLNNAYTTLDLLNIAQDVIYLDLTVDVLMDGYVIATLSPRITINRNLTLLVNGTTDITDDYRVRYIMTDKHLTSSEFPYSLSLSGRFEGFTVEYNSVQYFDCLDIEIVDLLNNETGLGLNPATITTNNSNVTFANDTLIFAKDFTGDLQLTITVNLGSRGTKTFTIVVEIVGFADMTYANNSESAIIGSNSGGYESGAEVRVIHQNSASDPPTDSAILLSNNSSAMQNDSRVSWVSGYEILMSYQYKITNTAPVATQPMEYIWNNISTEPSSSVDVELTTNYYSITLPYITSSANAYVIYRFTFNYLGTEEVRYATYYVQGSQVTVVETSPSSQLEINVDNQLVETTSGSTEHNYLPLFYYAEQYTYGSQVFTFTANGEGQLILNVNMGITALNGQYIYNEVTGNYEKDSYYFTYPTWVSGNNYSISYYYTSLQTLSVEREVQNVYKSGAIESLYTINNVSSVSDYANFVSSLNNLVLSDLVGVYGTDTSKTYRIVETSIDGLFGIDLGTSQLFTNELSATLTVYSIGATTDAYLVRSSVLLKGNSTITANDSRTLSQIFGSTQPYLTNYSIVAITDNSSPSQTVRNGWVEHATSSSIGGLVETFTYGNQTISIYSVNYFGNASSSLYTINATMYFAYATGGQITVLTSNSVDVYADATDSERVVSLETFIRNWSYSGIFSYSVDAPTGISENPHGEGEYYLTNGSDGENGSYNTSRIVIKPALFDNVDSNQVRITFSLSYRVSDDLTAQFTLTLICTRQ